MARKPVLATVYRIEHGETGEGPFAGHAQGSRHYDAWYEPPGPLRDFGLSVWELARKVGTTTPNVLFGFADAAQAGRWLHKADAWDELAAAGFVVREYRMRKSVTRAALCQAIFNKLAARCVAQHHPRTFGRIALAAAAAAPAV